MTDDYSDEIPFPPTQGNIRQPGLVKHNARVKAQREADCANPKRTITTEEAELLAERLSNDAEAPQSARYQPYTDHAMCNAATALRSLAVERDALEEAARRLEELHKNHKYKPETGEGSEHDTGYYRAIAEGVAHIRALSDTPPGTYASEAEQERDEFFNRLGRITEELRLPMDATASRIIEAIRERVDNEREACASVSVKVVVPEGAETWTPLEAWEEALNVFDDAFRDAIRSRAPSDTPTNMVLVPREPTEAMIQACLQAALDFMAETKTTEVHPGQTYPNPSENARRCWRAMVRAAEKGETND